MKRHIILTAACFLPLSLMAQNLNPEVQVTNEYEIRINDVVKQGPSMTVPDSMLRFDYHFDYFVFDSPYKGAYEFSPYSVRIAPDAGTYDGRKLYLQAGAGWLLKPELDLTWAAIDGKKAALNVFAKGDGFYGLYRRIDDDKLTVDPSDKDWGWDFRTVGGIESRFNIGKAVLRAELAYDGIFTGHEIYHNGIGHAPYANINFRRDNADGFSYSANVRYRYVNDRFEGVGLTEDHDVRVDAAISPYVNKRMRIGVDALFTYNTWYWGAGVKPHILFRAGNWDFDAGFRLDYTDRLTICPDVNIVFHAFDNYLDIYAGAVGQNHHLSYWDYKTIAHHFVDGNNYPDPQSFREIADLFLGARGFADFGLRYDVKAGYRFLENAPFWGIGANGRETIIFHECNMLHADLALAWQSKRFDVAGGFHYKWLPYGVGERVFAPASYTADLKIGYNWMKRIYVGIGADFASDRCAYVGEDTVTLPWYIDLGARAEYKLTKKVGLWLKGSNLINMDIRQSPMYSPCGPAVIAGVTLSL